MSSSIPRREFMKGAAGVGATLGMAAKALAAKETKTVSSRVLGANDRINIGVIGVGGRGAYLADQFAKLGARNNSCQIMAVCDVWRKRVTQAKEKHKCDGYLDYREVVNRGDVDAVAIAAPDHWHATMALAAMDRGKDVYLEKPMCHTVEEAKHLANTVRETKRVLQVGSQTTSADQWHKARKVIADGMIGPMIMSQGSYHRNSTEGEWNWPIDKDASPEGKGDNFIDWKAWLGPAQKRAYDPDRYFRFRKYWDYSGGVATDLFFHVAAPLNICWGEPQFPYKVMAGGSISVFKDREVPDTFHLIGEYAKGHTVVLSSSMANSQHIPGLIRGHWGTLIMVEHGEFEGLTPHITVRPEKKIPPAEYNAKFGEEEIKIPVEQPEKGEWDAILIHIGNFLDCMRSRQKPTLDVETAARAQVLISMAVQSYREGRILYFDERNWKVVGKPPKV